MRSPVAQDSSGIFICHLERRLDQINVNALFVKPGFYGGLIQDPLQQDHIQVIA